MKSNRSRHAIGFLVADFVGGYEYSVWTGVQEACEEMDVDLLCFTGGEVGSPNKAHAEKAKIFQKANPDNIDGLLVLAPAVSNHLSELEVREYLKPFSVLPIVCLGAQVDGYPCVLTDNRTGVVECVEHLITKHGRRRFLFLSGPEGNKESQERYEAFRETLRRHGIEPDPRHKQNGRFIHGRAHLCVKALLDAGEFDFDAIVAANDEMALGSLDALRASGLRVPEDVSLTGFDDIDDAQYSSPAMTTIMQPLKLQGRRGMELLMELVSGEGIPESNVVLNTELIVRQSCGCLSQAVSEAFWHLHAKDDVPPKTRTQIQRGLQSQAPIGALPGDSERILAAFTEATETGNFADILRQLKVGMRQTLEMGGDPWKWQDYISTLRRDFLPALAVEQDKYAVAESLLHMARVAIGEVSVQTQAYAKVLQERQILELIETSGLLINSFDLDLMIQLLARRLPIMGIGTAYMSLSGQDFDGRKRLLLAIEDGQILEIPKDGIPLTETSLLPEAFRRKEKRRTMVVEPLFFNHEDLGIILFEITPRRHAIYEALRNQISAALAGWRLVFQVRSRTQELENAYQALQNNQKQLLLSEKMASLGKLTAGIAHEINTPLSAVRSSLEELRGLATEFRDSIHDPDVTPADQEQMAEEMLRALGIAIRGGQKASQFVRSIKSQTRDMGSKDKQIFDAVPILEESILLLSHALRAAKVDVQLQFEEKSIFIMGIADRLSQVVTNLITNAVDSLENKSDGRIIVSLRGENGQIVLTVADNGCGIPEANLTHIFDPLFTTKAVGKGTGLGLTIIHDIVYSDFSGEIRLDSTPNEGTSVRVYFPAPVEGGA